MLDLIKRFELIQKKEILPFMPGSIENIFIYNEKCGKNEDGTIPVIVRPEVEEKKKKKAIN